MISARYDSTTDHELASALMREAMAIARCKKISRALRANLCADRLSFLLIRLGTFHLCAIPRDGVAQAPGQNSVKEDLRQFPLFPASKSLCNLSTGNFKSNLFPVRRLAETKLSRADKVIKWWKFSYAFRHLSTSKPVQRQEVIYGEGKIEERRVYFRRDVLPVSSGEFHSNPRT